MLTIHINHKAAGLVSYFTHNLRRDDYFFSGDATPGRWHGRLAKSLDLPEKVSRKTFSRLAHNRHPVTGEKLTMRDHAARRTSIEYTFSAPKSVSLVMALGDTVRGRAILNAHRRAVKFAMTQIEADMHTQTRIQGRKTYVRTGNIVYGRFDHYSSRPTALEDGAGLYAPDPQLHSHCICFNMTQYKGRLQAIEGSPVHRMAGYYEALYHAALSKALTDLGYAIIRTPKRWEIKSPGLTKRTLDRFSRRTAVIEKTAQALKITSAKAKARLGATTRVSKAKAAEGLDVKTLWQNRLTRIEKNALQTAHMQGVLSSSSMSADRAVEAALSHVLERQSSAPVKKVIAAALARGYGDVTLQTVEKALHARDDILYARKNHLRYLTTKEMVRAEDKMLAFASQGKNTLAPIHPSYGIQRGFLNQDQCRAVQHILRTPDRVAILSGAAGVGKSTLLQEIKAAADQKNKQIIALATSTAARDVLREKGFADAHTIAAFFKTQDAHKSADGHIMLVDEASLVGTKTMGQLFDAAKRLKRRVILSGDPRQHGSVAFGAALKQLEDKARLKVARVDKILRQRHNPSYKKAIDLMAAGRVRAGFDQLDKMKAIVEINDIEARHDAIANAYVGSLARKRSALVVCPTHAEGRMIAKDIRDKMKARGRIAGQDHLCMIHKNLSLTAAQKNDHAMYAEGMRIQFHQNYKGGYKAGRSYAVHKAQNSEQVFIQSEHDKAPLPLPYSAYERFQVFQIDTLNVARGDLIRITHNGRSIEKSRVHNGQVFAVQDITSAGDIQLSHGKTLPKNFGHFMHAYVQTSHGAQGKDAQDVYVAQSQMSMGAANEKQLYVSTSRGIEHIQIFTDDKQALRAAVCKSGETMTALEVKRRAAQQKRQTQHRRDYYAQHLQKLDKNGRSKRQTEISIQGPVQDRD